MTEISIEKLLEESKISRYALVVATAKRGRNIDASTESVYLSAESIEMIKRRKNGGRKTDTVIIPSLEIALEEFQEHYLSVK